MGTPFLRYLVIALGVLGVLAGGRAIWGESIKIGCLPPGGVNPPKGWFEACASDRIGDYGHSAVWFGTEPSIIPEIQAAKVLIFGDSRMEFAISRGNGASWFADRHISFYLLAFGYGEQSGWAQRLLQRLHPRPKILVFDTDPYFTGGQSLPAAAIEANPANELRTALSTRRFFQEAPRYCRLVPWLCGRTAGAYRSTVDGHVFDVQPERFWFGVTPDGDYPITTPPPAQSSLYPQYLANARAVLATAAIPSQCVVFTIVPNDEQDDTLAHYLAAHLNATVITPQLTGLSTLDHWHLTADSSRRWTAALLKAMTPLIQRCAGSPPSSPHAP